MPSGLLLEKMSLVVSCIMPTRGRPQMARESVECFLSQTWPEKELLILDDADEPSFDRAPGGVLYEAARVRMSVGVKRNLLCSRARGVVIAHWDDDDWSAPGRLEDQVTRLVESGAPITGYNTMEFRQGEKRWEYIGSENYALGTSLCYLRSHWAAHPFPDVYEGEDNRLVFESPKIASVPAHGLMWARIHPGNTSVKKPASNPAQWKDLDPCCA